MNSLIRWFAQNSTAANLLMLFLIAAGAFSLLNMKQELFPKIEPNIITISTIYPGATPEQVEEAVCIKIEEAIDGIEGIKRVTSKSNEGSGFVTVQMFWDTDWDQILDDVKSAVDGITTFPDDVEKPVVTQIKFQSAVLNVAISGHLDDVSLRRLSEDIRDEVTALPSVTNASLLGTENYEMSVEIKEETLRRLDLTFDDVTRAIRANSINLSLGDIETSDQQILIRANDQAYTAEDFEAIPVKTHADGTRIFVRDVAEVHDGFEDTDQLMLFNGTPALILGVNRVGEQSVPNISVELYEYVEKKQIELDRDYGGDVKLDIWADFSKQLEGRKDLLIKNGVIGFFLIFIILALFLKLNLAFWASVGVATAGIGTFLLMPMTDQSINMMTLFAFIVVIGIMVDDAIIVSENIYFHRFKLRKSGLKAAIEGTIEVSTPVLIAVSTTIAAFLPMASMGGVTGQFAGVVPKVVVLALILSLVESLLILPSHLAHLKHHKPYKSWDPRKHWERFQEGFNGLVERLINKLYRPTLRIAIKWRYAVIAGSFAVFLSAFSLSTSGRVGFIFFPTIEGDNMIAFLTMPTGTPAETTEKWIKHIEEVGREVIAEASDEYYAGEDKSLLTQRLATVGTQPTLEADSWQSGGGTTAASHIGEVNLELVPAETRPDSDGINVSATTLLQRWRERVGNIPEAVELTYKVDISGNQKAVAVQFMSDNEEHLRAAADELKAHLATAAGGAVFGITDDMRAGKPEFRPTLLPKGEALGLTQAELARQVNQAFFGDEAQRFQRGRDDVRVYVRYPESEQEALGAIEELRIRLSDGREIPFKEVATGHLEPGLSSINRARRERSVEIMADVDTSRGASPDAVNNTLRQEVLPEITAKYAGLSWSMEGQNADNAEAMKGMVSGTLLAIFLIFALLSLAFRNFGQPIIVLLAVPFGVAGAIIGHYGFTELVTPTPLTILSLVGILGMAGVVVNDSMILVDFINRARKEGVELVNAVLEAGPRRFRAIIITSLTTFAGLFPMLLERSVQAQFLVPMAISLAFGVSFATFFILVFVPSLYLVYDDVVGGIKRVWATAFNPDALAEPALAITGGGARARSTQTGSDFSAMTTSSEKAGRTSIFETVLNVSERESAERSTRRGAISTINAAFSAGTSDRLPEMAGDRGSLGEKADLNTDHLDKPDRNELNNRDSKDEL